MVYKHFTLKNKYNSIDRSARIKIENTHRGEKQIQLKFISFVTDVCRSTSKAYLFSRLWVWRQRGPWCISFFTFLILLLKGSGRWKFLTMGTPKQKQEVFPRVSFLSLVLSLGFALHFQSRKCGAYRSFEKL